jgi:Fis family transcriptional regulator
LSTFTIFDKKLIIQHIKSELESTRHDRHATPDMSWVIPMVKDELFEQTLVYTRGNQSKAAEQLGVNRGTYRKRVNEIRNRRAWLE